MSFNIGLWLVMVTIFIGLMFAHPYNNNENGLTEAKYYETTDRLISGIDANIANNLEEAQLKNPNANKDLYYFIKGVSRGMTFALTSTIYLGKYIDSVFPWVYDNWFLLFIVCLIVPIIPWNFLCLAILGLILIIKERYFVKKNKMKASWRNSDSGFGEP
jgi:hypothetical protein